MSEYYMGLIVGALIGYGLSIATLLVIWSLCVIAKKEDMDRVEQERRCS